MRAESDMLLHRVSTWIENYKETGRRATYIVGDKEIERYKKLFKGKKSELIEAMEIGALDIYVFEGDDSTYPERGSEAEKELLRNSKITPEDLVEILS